MRQQHLLAILAMTGLGWSSSGCSETGCPGELTSEASSECVDQGAEWQSVQSALADDPSAPFEATRPPAELPPRAIACHAACERISAETFEQCISHGLGERVCHERASTLMKSCTARRCDTTTAPRTNECALECNRLVDRNFDTCLEVGASKRTCASRSEHLLEACLLEECTPAKPPIITEAPSCEDSCKNEGEATYTACIDTGNDAIECQTRAALVIESCLVDTCAAPPSEPASAESCTSPCEEVFNREYSYCMEDGGPQAQCQEHAHRKFDACAETECAG